MNKFFEKLSEIKYNICPDSPLDEIAKSMIVYFENKETIDHFLSFNKNISNNENNEDDENFYYDLKISWKDLSKLFSTDDIQNKNELNVFLYLNLEIGELILSNKLLDYFVNITDQKSWEIIVKDIKPKKPLTVSIQLDPGYKNNIKVITTYETDTNLLHVNLEKENE